MSTLHSKTCWVVYDKDKVGTLNQCLGLAEALHLEPILKPIVARFPWSYFPPSLWFSPLKGLTRKTRLEPPWPKIIIGGGRASAAPVAEIRRLTRGRTKTIQLLNPYLHPRHFDMVIVPEHDRLQGPNVVQTLGPLHRVTPQRIAEESKNFSVLKHLPRPLVAVLIGGSNKHYKLDKTTVTQLVQDLKRLVIEDGYHLIVTVSRRTSVECRAYLKEQLHGLILHYWEGEGPNPYFAYLGVADIILVTGDSISMITEAASTGKPLYVYALPGHSKKFSRFYQVMEKTIICDGLMEDLFLMRRGL